MLNKKLIVAGSIALVALAACSSDEASTAGATVDPNAIAENDSIVFEGDKPIIPELMDHCYSNQDSATNLCGNVSVRLFRIREQLKKMSND